MQRNPKDANLAQQIRTLIAIPVAFQIVFVAFLVSRAADLEKTYNGEERVREIVIAQNRAVVSILHIASNFVLYHSTGNAQFKPDRQKDQEALQDEKNALDMVTQSDRDRFKSLDNLVSQTMDLLKGTHSDFQSDEPEARQANLIEVGGLIRKIGTTMDEDKITIDQLNSEAHQNEHRSAQWFNASIILGLGGNALIAILCFIYFQRQIVKALLKPGSISELTQPGQIEPTPLIGNAADGVELKGSPHKQVAGPLKEKARKESERIRQPIIALVSREFRSPLTAIEMTLKTLKSGSVGDLSDKALERLERAQQSIEQLISMINDLSVIDKAERKVLQLKLSEAVDEDIISAAKLSLEERASKAKVNIDVVTEGIIFRCDEKLLVRAVSSLLLNAIKNSPPGSSVEIRTVNELEGIRFIVNDSGKGIAEDLLPRIFDLQEQDASELEKQPGALELSFCKAIIEAHKGTIGATSTVGSGSTYWFVIPSPR